MNVTNGALIRRRIADVRRAMRQASRAVRETGQAVDSAAGMVAPSAQPAAARDPRHLIGRWALPSGAAFTVRWIDEPNARALCSGGGRRWWLTITDLHAMLDRGQLRYLGIGRA